jgi:hypothetical protein
LSIGTGTAWHGYRVKQGPVAYVLAEGIGGLPRRVEAWLEYYDWSGNTGVRFLPQPVEMLNLDQAARLVTDLETWDPPPKLAVVDTLNWCLAPNGNENSPESMGGYVRAIGALRAATGATVLTVHHTGHDTSRERGHTSLKAGMDTSLAVKMDGGTITVKCDKQKDGPRFKALRFELTEAGESVTVRPVDYFGDSRELGSNDLKALEALQAITRGGEQVGTTAWKGTADLAHNSFFRCRRKLLEGGYAAKRGRHHVVTDSGRQVLEREVP